MKNLNLKKIKGYIEGYYGKILSWNDRKRIIDKLAQNKMNYYFYCPKEDIYHRLKWRTPYNSNFLAHFEELNHHAKKNKINIIAGISPGLDFNYKSFVNGYCKDFEHLSYKINQFVKIGIKNIAILFDDIPKNNDFKTISIKEGTLHAKIANKIYSSLDAQVFTVPRIYSDELNIESPKYLEDYFFYLNKNIYTFFSGKYIVSQKFDTKLSVIKEKVSTKSIIYWDNYYANDYCPKKFFIGPWKNTNLINKSMINGTGLIETDLLILEIVSQTYAKKNKKSAWEKVLVRNNIPNQFFKVSKHFLSPNFTNEKKIKPIKFSNSAYNSLDFLLWKWKNALSREWYPYLLNLKHDLQILDKKLSLNRIIKTQTNPLQNVLINRKELDE